MSIFVHICMLLWSYELEEVISLYELLCNCKKLNLRHITQLKYGKNLLRYSSRYKWGLQYALWFEFVKVKQTLCYVRLFNPCCKGGYEEVWWQLLNRTLMDCLNSSIAVTNQTYPDWVILKLVSISSGETCKVILTMGIQDIHWFIKYEVNIDRVNGKINWTAAVANISSTCNI